MPLATALPDEAAVPNRRGSTVVPPAPLLPDYDPPIWQVIPALRRNALLSWPRRAYAERNLLRPFLHRRNLISNDPAVIRHVLIDHTERFGRTIATHRVLRPILGERGLFLAEGDAWRQARRTLAPAFAPRSDAVVAHSAASAAEDALNDLAAKPDDLALGVDLLSWARDLALDVAGRALFSLDLRSAEGRRIRQSLMDYGLKHSRISVLDMVLPLRLNSPADGPRQRFSHHWRALIQRVIDARAAQGRQTERPADLFDLLFDGAEASDPSDLPARTRSADLADQVATLIIAGHETTALTMFWCFYLLTLAPDWQARLAEEAHNVDLDADPLGTFNALPWTKAVVQESLRLYPPAWAIFRVNETPHEAAGIALRRGDVITLAPWLLHRHAELWSGDPHAFDPTRFAPDAPAPDRFAYLPFGIGPRVCIGARFALIEATLALAATLRRYRIEAVAPKRPVLPVAIVTLAPDHQPRFHLHAR